MPVTKITINRNELAEIIDAPNAELISKKIVIIEDSPNIIYDMNTIQSSSKYNWKITPYGKVHLFDPAKPIYYDTGIRIILP